MFAWSSKSDYKPTSILDAILNNYNMRSITTIRKLMDGIMHKWTNPHLDDYKIFGVFESSHHKLYLTKEPNV